MKIALAQMRVVPNMQGRNLETMLRMIEEAKKQKVDLIAFPEMCVGGYLLSDMWLNEDFCRDLMEFNEIFDVLNDTTDAGAVYSGREWTYRGNIFRNNFVHDIGGRGRYYSAIYLDDLLSSLEIDGNIRVGCFEATEDRSEDLFIVPAEQRQLARHGRSRAGS